VDIRQAISRSATGLPPAISIAASVLAASSALSDRATQFSLVIAQTASVLWLGRLGWSRVRGWATATVFVSAAWVPTLLISSWIYVIDPSLLDVGSPTQALALVELSLLALIAGFALWRRRRPFAPSSHVELVPRRPSRRAVVNWAIIGVSGLAIVLAEAGGPTHYLRNFNHGGSLTQGRVYFIVLAQALLFTAQVVLFLRWSRHQRVDRSVVAGLIAATVLVGILGSRLLLVLAFVQIALFYGLIRPRRPLGVLAPAVVVAAVLITLVVGAARRYSNYHAQHPGNKIGLVQYLWSVAPGEIPVAFANNYADGVRLIALSRATVPRYAGYEYGKELLRLLLQPLPHGIRPTVNLAPGLKEALYPGNGDSVYAQPLQVVSYLQFGIPGVAVAFLLLGLGLAELDFRLASIRRARPSTLVLLTGIIVEVLATVRGASAPSVGFSLASLALMYVVARSTERPIAVR
jgi:hypothetical protein